MIEVEPIFAIWLSGTSQLRPIIKETEFVKLWQAMNVTGTVLRVSFHPAQQ